MLVLDVAFQGNEALALSTVDVTALRRPGGASESPSGLMPAPTSIGGTPQVVIREITPGFESLLFGIGGKLYEAKWENRFVSISEVRARADIRLHVSFNVSGTSFAASLPEELNAHILRASYPYGTVIACLMSKTYASVPRSPSRLLLLKESEAVPLLDTEVYIRNECPPIDIRGDFVALMSKWEVLVAPLHSWILLRLEGIAKEVERPVTIALDEKGEILACALRDWNTGHLRFVQFDLRSLLHGSAFHPKVIAEGQMIPQYPEDVPPPERDAKIIPLRIAPSLDWMVARTSVFSEGALFDYVFAAELKWERV